MNSLCIIFTSEAFFPKDGYGNSKTEMPLAAYTLIISLFTGSFGITKFFIKGPLPILPQDAPLAGILSIKFLTLLLLNTMFVIRTFCIECSLFSSYRSYRQDNIDPMIPEEYRLVFYLLPGLVSFLINMIKLALSIKPKDFRYFKKFPQFLLCPMFCPLMFEGNPDRNGHNEPPVRVWKLGSILNSIFMGCIPQIMLIAFDHYRKVPDWNFETSLQDNNALLKSPTGNFIFSITTLALYLCLTTIFFSWNILFKNDGLLCTLCKTLCRPFSNPCSSPIPEESDPSTVNDDEEEENDHEPSMENPSPAGSFQGTENEERENSNLRDVPIVDDEDNVEEDHEPSIRDAFPTGDIMRNEGMAIDLEVNEHISLFDSIT